MARKTGTKCAAANEEQTRAEPPIARDRLAALARMTTQSYHYHLAPPAADLQGSAVGASPCRFGIGRLSCPRHRHRRGELDARPCRARTRSALRHGLLATRLHQPLARHQPRSGGKPDHDADLDRGRCRHLDPHRHRGRAQSRAALDLLRLSLHHCGQPARFRRSSSRSSSWRCSASGLSQGS